MADFITIAKQTYTPSGSDTLVKFDLIFADATIGGSKISGAVIDLDYNYSVVTLSSATSPTYVDELGGTPNVWSNVVPNLSGATANGKIALTAAFDSFNPILGADQKALSVTLKVPGSTTSFPVTLQSDLGSENYITTENGVKHDLDGGALPSASETPTLTLQLADTTRMVDEDAHNTGLRIAFNGDTGTVNVESGTGKTAKNQLDLTATGITDFTGYTLSVSLDNYGSGDNILKLGLGTRSGVFGVNATSGEVTYYESATYSGADVYDTDGKTLLHKSGYPVDGDTTGTVIGTRTFSESGALTITLNSAASTEIVEALASHIVIKVVDGSGNATENWLAVDDQVVTATFTLGNGTTTATDTRSIQFISQPDLIGSPVQLWGTDTNGTTLKLFDHGEGKPDRATVTDTWTEGEGSAAVIKTETADYAIAWGTDNSGKWTAYLIEEFGLSGSDNSGRPTTLVLGPDENETAPITWETTVTNGVLGTTSWTETWQETDPSNTSQTIDYSAVIALKFVDKQPTGTSGTGVISVGDWVVGTKTETVGNVSGQAKNFTFEVKGLTATGATLKIVTSDFVGEDIITGTATFNGTTLTSMNWLAADSGTGGGSTETTVGTVVKGPISGATVFRDMDGDFTLDTGEATATTTATGAFTLAGSGGVIVATGGKDMTRPENADSITTNDAPFVGMLLAPSNATVVTPLTSLLVAGSQLSGGALTVTQLQTALGLGAIDPLTFNPFASGVDTAQALAAEKAAAQVYTVIATFTQALTTASGSASNAGEIMGVVAATLAGAIKPATSGTVVDLTNATTLSGILAAAESAVEAKLVTTLTVDASAVTTPTANATGSIASATDLDAVATVLDTIQDSLNTGGGSGTGTITGKLAFWALDSSSVQPLLEGVTLTLDDKNNATTNDQTDQTEVNGQANFAFESVASGNFAIEITGAEPALNAAITGDDALATLKLAAGLDPDGDASNDKYQFLAADVDEDGRVTSYDAFLIMQYALNAADTDFTTPRWMLVDEADMTATQTRKGVVDPGAPSVEAGDAGVSLIGILIGDVDGSWAPPA